MPFLRKQIEKSDSIKLLSVLLFISSRRAKFVHHDLIQILTFKKLDIIKSQRLFLFYKKFLVLLVIFCLTSFYHVDLSSSLLPPVTIEVCNPFT